MITAEEAARSEGFHQGQRATVERLRKQIDIAYQRGLDDASLGPFPVLVGMVLGGIGAALIGWMF